MPSFRSAFFFVAAAFVAFTSAAPPQPVNPEADLLLLPVDVGAKAELLGLLGIKPVPSNDMGLVVNTDVDDAELLDTRGESLAAQLAAVDAELDALVKNIEGAVTNGKITPDEAKDLEDLLSITGVPEAIKASRAGLKFVCRVLRTIGQSDSQAGQFIRDAIQTIDAGLSKYSEVLNKATRSITQAC